MLIYCCRDIISPVQAPCVMSYIVNIKWKKKIISWKPTCLGGAAFIDLFIYLQIKRALTWTVCGAISDANRYKTKVDINIFLICWYNIELKLELKQLKQVHAQFQTRLRYRAWDLSISSRISYEYFTRAFQLS